MAELNKLTGDVLIEGDIQCRTTYIRGFDRLKPDLMGDITYDFTARTFTIAPKGGQTKFIVWTKGIRWDKTASESVSFPDVTGTYYFYYDPNGVLQSIEHKDLTEKIFIESAIAGLCYYDAVDKTGWYASDEQHGVILDPSAHFNLHMTRGFKWAAGGNIEGLVDNQTTFSKITASLHFDEDIAIAAPEYTTLPFMYRSGANGEWKITSADNKIGYINGGDTYISYNKETAGVWGLEESTSSTDYIIYFIIKTNFATHPYRKVIGQSAFPNRSSARDALINELELIKFDGMASTEIEFEFAYICKRNGRLEDDGNGNPYIDLRTMDGTAGSSATTLWLRNATNGTINPLSLTDKLGIGTDTPQATLEVEGDVIGHRAIGTAITATKTLTLTDKNRYLRCTNTTDAIITVPPNSSVAYLIGTEIEFIRTTTNEVTFLAGTGVTINSKDGNLSLDSQYSACVLKKVATDVWDLIGDLKA